MCIYIHSTIIIIIIMIVEARLCTLSICYHLGSGNGTMLLLRSMRVAVVVAAALA